MVTTSGFQTLHDIDRSLQTSRKSLQQLDIQIDQGSHNALRFHQQEAKLYQELAKIYLDKLQAKQVKDDLNIIDKQAVKLLQQRDDYLKNLIVQIENTEKSIHQLENEREQQSTEITNKTEKLEDLLAKIHQHLENDLDYTEHKKQTQIAVNQATASKEKADKALLELETKGEPYHQDQLFSYLWQRHFGTSQYKIIGLFKTLDQYLANFINYESLRQNYSTLEAIPERLSEHANNLQQIAEKELTILQKKQADVEKKEKIPEYEKQLNKILSTLEQIDQQIKTKEQNFKNQLAERQLTLAGEDDYFKQAIHLLVQNFQQDNIRQLRKQVEKTPNWEDDQIVAEVSELRDDKALIEEQLVSNQRLHQKQLERIHQLENIRLQFKQNRYDMPNSHFSKSGMVAVLLQEFLKGVVNSDDLWRTIERSQRFERQRRVRYPNQHHSFPRGINIPSSFGHSSSSHGGFRTGGGF